MTTDRAAEERRARWHRDQYDREKCRVCGLLRINVCHEIDPDNAPEGKAYYDAMKDDMHPFAPSGEYVS